MEGAAKCSTRSRCNQARECEYCGKTRQMRIAGMAEKIEQQYGPLTMTVIKPKENTAAAVKAVHASFMRRALAPAGIWTIETGELFNGLHLNVLSPEPLAAKWRNCNTYSELVRTTARDAGAYIAKQEGIPDRQQYAGRLFGSWGQIGEILATQQRFPVVQAAALEVAMGGGQVKGEAMKDERIFSKEQDWARHDPAKANFYNPAFPMECNPPLKLESGSRERTKEERAEMMRRHLPKLYEAQGRVYK